MTDNLKENNLKPIFQKLRPIGWRNRRLFIFRLLSTDPIFVEIPDPNRPLLASVEARSYFLQLIVQLKGGVMAEVMVPIRLLGFPTVTVTLSASRMIFSEGWSWLAIFQQICLLLASPFSAAETELQLVHVVSLSHRIVFLNTVVNKGNATTVHLL